MKMPVPSFAVFALPFVPACQGDCPPGSSRHDDGLCYLNPAEDDETDTGSATGPTDTGEKGAEWQPVPAGCEPAASSGDDPLVEVGREFVQEYLFAEGTDVELDGDVAWSAGQGGVWSVDISDPTAPTYLGSATEGGSRWYNVHPGPDPALYVTSRDLGFGVFDRSDPAHPRLVSQSYDEGLAGMDSEGDRLYVASLQGSLVTFDISDPLAPVKIDELGGLGNAWAVRVSGYRAYVADNALGLVVIDLSDPDAPEVVTRVETASGGAQDLALSEDGSVVYVAAGGAGVEAYSLADPDAPLSLGAIDVSYAVISVAVGGDTLWAVDQQDVVAFDIRDPAAPALVNTEHTEQWAMHVAADADRAWVADWGYLAGYERRAGVTAPDADLSTGQVFLPDDGGSVTFTLRNLGNADLELLGASPSDDRVAVEAQSLLVPPGGSTGLRLSWEGGSDLDATVCFATNDPDEPTAQVIVRGNQSGNPALGTPAPDFTLTGLDGETYTLSEQLGRPVFLAFFATW